MPTMSTKPEPEVALEREEECTFPCWRNLVDHVLLHIFSFLQADSLVKAGLVCKTWLQVAFDELLWKDLFYRHYGIPRSIPMAPNKYSWIQEYKRLLYHTPSVESEVLKQHTDQVLHVSFSHNGKMFATCSKDGHIRVWDASYPTSLKYKSDMKKLTWKYTQFSQFNSTDTLLLVSGVHFGSLSTSGEIAVFSLEGEFVVQSRVMNKPYDVFGTWYNDFYLLSGNLQWTGHLNSSSAIWLNKAYQETSSEEESVVMKLFTFSNINASSIRTIMVANCANNECDVISPENNCTSNAGITNDSAQLLSQVLTGDVVTCRDDDSEQEGEDVTDEAGQDSGDETKPVKIAKNLQSIQMFENGAYIMKYLEVDPDVPSSKLNGTIKYSNDYRQAEVPEKSISRLIDADMSELSTNDYNSGSENSDRSAVNSSSDVLDFWSSSAEMEISKCYKTVLEEAQADDSSQPLFGNVTEEIPNRHEHVTFTLEQVPGCSYSANNSSMLCVSNDYRGTKSQEHSSDPATGMASQSMSEKYVNSKKTVTFPVTAKRVLFGQQQIHGELIRDPSTSDLTCPDDTSAVNTSKAHLNVELNPKVPFCCADYKKQKKLPYSKPTFEMPVTNSDDSIEMSEMNRSSNYQSNLSTDSWDDQSTVGASFDCVPRRVHSSICTGPGTFIHEFRELQSVVDTSANRPARSSFCKMRSSSQTVLPSSRPANVGTDELAGYMSRCHYNTKKIRKGKEKQNQDKYLIFTKGSETYTPHQIGIKKILPLKTFSHDGSRLLPNVSKNTHNLERREICDEVDHLIDMHGHIIGMTLSPDQRYLYVNSRPWPKNYFIEDPLHPPPIAQEIDIHVIDLLNMREVGTMHRAHKAYTSNDECFFIFLDVCEEYVASGAEDKHGYLWDRHYGLCLHKYPHSDVVNSVAFNPADPEVLVTVSDDFSIKIWRSLSREKEVVKAYNKEHSIRLKHVQAIMSDTNEFPDISSSGNDQT